MFHQSLPDLLFQLLVYRLRFRELCNDICVAITKVHVTAPQNSY